MSPTAFTLSVPADERFRGLASSVVKAYLDLTGRTAAVVEAVTAAVASAVDRLSAHGTDVELTLSATDADVTVRLSCGREQETLAFPVTAS